MEDTLDRDAASVRAWPFAGRNDGDGGPAVRDVEDEASAAPRRYPRSSLSERTAQPNGLFVVAVGMPEDLGRRGLDEEPGHGGGGDEGAQDDRDEGPPTQLHACLPGLRGSHPRWVPPPLQTTGHQLGYGRQ